MDAETGWAPIFDSGSSLGYDKAVSRISSGFEQAVCKPFKKRHDEQLKLVTSFDWIDFDALKGADILIREALSEPQAADFVGQDRVEVIAGAVQQRVQTLQSMAMTLRPLSAAFSAEHDVEEDVADSYAPKMTM